MSVRPSLLTFIVTLWVIFAQAQTPQRIGYFGGTFDPPTLGHLNLVLRSLRQGGLDRVYVQASISNSFKPSASAHYHRQNMVRLNFEDHDRVFVTDQELDNAFAEDRATGALRVLKRRFPMAKLLRITGDDVISRNLTPHIQLNMEFADVGFIVGRRAGAMALIAENLDLRKFQGRELIVLSSVSDLGISSSQVRREILEKGTTSLVQPAVMTYIRTNRLYPVMSQYSCTNLFER
jgi:nicotinate-nucleotide adenylyltransferase